MDLLTKSLLEDLLENPITVALYGGGFKPPTKGHFNVVEKTLEELPDIDQLILYVGGGERDGITQEESLKVWDIYKNYLSPKVIIEPSVAPIKSILNYAKNNPTHKVYWILGARDGDEGDLADIANRTRSIDKYPNLEVKVITSSGGVSGTKTRQAIKSNNKEQFLYMIPDVEEKEEIWNILKPAIKESKSRAQILKERQQKIQEGFFENMKTKFQKFLAALKQEGQETKEAVGLLIHAAQGKIELTDKDKEYIGNQLKDVLKTIGLVGIAALPGGFIAAALIKLFKAEHLVTPSAFVNEVGEANLKPYKWEETDVEGYFVYTSFTTDNETEYNVDLESKMYVDDDFNNLRALGVEFSAKPKGAEGSSTKIVVNKGELYRVMATIVDIVKKYVKKSKAQVILYSPSKKSSEEDFGTQRDNLYKAFISKAFPGAKFEQEGEIVAAILPNINEGTCGYDTDVATGKKLDTPGGLEEGRPKKKDPKKGTGKKPEGSGRRLYTDEDPKDTVRIKFKTKEDIVDTLNKKQFKAKSHARQSQVINLIHQRVRAAYGKAKDPEVKSRLKRALDYIESRKESSKEKTKRLNKLKEEKELNVQDLAYQQIPGLLEKGIDYGLAHFKSFIKSFYKWSGTKDKNEFFDFIESLNGEIKRVPLSSIIPSQKGKDYKNASSESEAEEFQKILDGEKSVEDHRKEDFYPIVVNKRDNKIIDGNHRHYALSSISSPYAVVLYIDVPEKYLQEASDPQAGTALPYGSGFAPVKELVTSTEVICDNCGWEWKKEDGGDDLYICHKCGHDNTPNSLNEGRYDSISRQLAKLTLNYWKEGFAKGKNEVNYIDRITPDEYPTDLEFLYNGGVIFTPAGGKYSHNGYAMAKGETKDNTPRVGVNYFVPKDMIPQGWEEIYMDLITTLRHEIEHLTQAGGNVKQGKEISSDMKLRKLIDANKDVVRYVLLPKEVDANVQGLYLKAKKWRRPYAEVVDEWIRDFAKIKKQSDIDLIKGVYNKRAKELNLPSILENDPFGLNEYAKEFVKEIFHETWNPQEDFLSLCVFMRDNGMNITPLPKIKVIKDDEENASRLLGKTAYYNPADKSITLYTLGRHPKDVLRSFAHEMVHHEQNLNGTLGNITTTNTNEDDHLQELEKEAYLKGNIMFRNWEDSIKNV